METYLVHHGILGQKWGVRRFQNSDGTLTEAGKKRYNAYTEKLQKTQKQIDKWDDIYKKSLNKKFTVLPASQYALESIKHQKKYEDIRKKGEQYLGKVKFKKAKTKLTDKDYDNILRKLTGGDVTLKALKKASEANLAKDILNNIVYKEHARNMSIEQQMTQQRLLQEETNNRINQQFIMQQVLTNNANNQQIYNQVQQHVALQQMHNFW